MKKLIYILSAISLSIFLLTSCESDKTYDGPAQVAFASKTAAYNVTANTTIAIPVQLIADGPQGDITVNVSVNSTSTTTAAAVTVPTTVTIPAGRFVGEIPVTVSYDNLAAGNANKLILDLSSDKVKVAASYGTLTVTFTKK